MATLKTPETLGKCFSKNKSEHLVSDKDGASIKHESTCKESSYIIQSKQLGLYIQKILKGETPTVQLISKRAGVRQPDESLMTIYVNPFEVGEFVFKFSSIAEKQFFLDMISPYCNQLIEMRDKRVAGGAPSHRPYMSMELIEIIKHDDDDKVTVDIGVDTLIFTSVIDSLIHEGVFSREEKWHYEHYHAAPQA